MGTAGLNVDLLIKGLRRRKIDCELIEGDSAADHCILNFSSIRFPERLLTVRYENQGFEPRLAQLRPTLEKHQLSQNSTMTIYLSGSRHKDVGKLISAILDWFEVTN
jgi:hypothetical protein